MSDKMREEFHEWCRSIGFTLKINAWGNDYAIGYGWEQWQAWQASRAALVVDLPEKAALMSASSVYSALDDAGVSYK